jgi:NAD(P)-dependent dehydrogenase (short-subunit alcohol dehydrogenase family)
MGRLTGKVAIITGAASGIGEATAKLFALEGASLLLADWQEERGEKVAEAVRKNGGKAAFVKTDVSKPEDVQAMVRAAMQEYGRLDVIFNNAGIEGEMNKPTADCTLENWHRVIGINLTGVFFGMKYAIPEMLNNGGGSIINTASVAGLVGFAGIPATAQRRAA